MTLIFLTRSPKTNSAHPKWHVWQDSYVSLDTIHSWEIKYPINSKRQSKDTRYRTFYTRAGAKAYAKKLRDTSTLVLKPMIIQLPSLDRR